MNQHLTSRIATLLLAALACACGATRGGPTEEFTMSAPHTVFVLAPRNDLVNGEQAETVRRALMRQLRKKGYGVSSAADAMLIPVVEQWGSRVDSLGTAPDRVTIAARLIDREDHLLWEDRGRAREEQDEDDEGGGLVGSLLDASVSRVSDSVLGGGARARNELVVEAVHDLLKSLPPAPKR